jgi:hypothetical protein
MQEGVCMDSLNFDILALETLELTRHLRQAHDLDFLEERFAHFDMREAEVSSGPVVIPESSGLVYVVEKGVNTFCVRGFATEDLAQSIDDLQNANRAERARLEVKNEVDWEADLRFFETESIETAQMIVDQLINRRFPRHEDMLCNLSDPGFSWWMRDEGQKLVIYFKSHAVERGLESIQLGPLGDKRIAEQRLSQSSAVLSKLFPLAEFSVSERVVVISTSVAGHAGFEAFKNMFSSGSNPFAGENYLGPTLYYFFQELASTRRFWLQVEAEVSE